MKDQLADSPIDTECPLCPYRLVFALEMAVSCCLRLDEMQRGWCNECHSWLKAQTGFFVNGGVEFSKAGCQPVEPAN
jgi:hypothetical protein